MAARFRLADISQSTLVDLLSGTMKLQYNSWSTRDPAMEGEPPRGRYGGPFVFQRFSPVEEQMTLLGSDTVGNLITGINAISAILEGVRLYNDDPAKGVSYWLEVNADGESPRRALIGGGGASTPTGIGMTPLLEKSKARQQLTLLRHPLWESVTAYAPSVANVSCCGGMMSLTGGGVVPGRIEKLQIQGRNGGGGPLYRFWAGIRPTYQGLTNFNPVWECEASADLTDCSTVADGTASGGYKKRITFATVPTMTGRFSGSLVTHMGGALSKVYVGRYLILARVKVDSGTVANVRFCTSMGTAGAMTKHKTCYSISNTSWRLLPLAVFDIPPMGYQSQIWADDLVMYWHYMVEAERVSGGGNLDMDVFYLIPARHMASVEGAQVQYVVDGYQPVKLYTYENDTHAALWYKNIPSHEYPDSAAAYSFSDWYLPVEGGKLVLVGEREASHVLTDTVDVSLAAYYRWRSFRGA